MKQLDLKDLIDAQNANKFSNIGTVATLNNHINQIYKILGNKVDDYYVFYRGHADSDYAPIPSIYRKNPVTGKSYIEQEESFCSGIVRECPAEFEKSGTAFEMLVKMQHYELPTRLLDITENPLVALYFACLEPSTKGNNGQLLIYFIHKDDVVNYNDLQVGALSSISFLPAGMLEKATDKKPLNSLLHNMKIYTDQLPYLNDLSDLDKVLCVLPKKSNPRIMRQQGAFFLYGIKNGKKSDISTLKIEPFILTVSNESRQTILKHLERYAISEKYLFPEIDNVAHYLKTH